MSLIIATLGTRSEKVVDGRRQQVIPFVGADREGEFAQIGIGFTLPDEKKGRIWGTAFPNALIQSWRGMKILEQIDCIGNATLCACWTIAQRTIHVSDERHFNKLAEQVGGADKLQTLRTEILGSAPSADELDAMITNLRLKHVDVSDQELREEVRSGRISTSILIEAIVRETEERRHARNREKGETGTFPLV